MPSSAARKEAEALRYRCQVMVGEVEAAARRLGRPVVAAEAIKIGARLAALELPADEAGLAEVRLRLEAERPVIEALARDVDLPWSRPPGLPRALRLLAIGGPLVVVLGLLTAILERRRRLRRVSREKAEAFVRRSESVGRATAEAAAPERPRAAPRTPRARGDTAAPPRADTRPPSPSASRRAERRTSDRSVTAAPERPGRDDTPARPRPAPARADTQPVAAPPAPEARTVVHPTLAPLDPGAAPEPPLGAVDDDRTEAAVHAYDPHRDR